jgi:cystathionine beta-lyase/cystathionine gamma-synthase
LSFDLRGGLDAARALLAALKVCVGGVEAACSTLAVQCARWLRRPGTNNSVALLQLVTVAPSLGGVETLVSLPCLTSHSSLREEELEAQGVVGG